MTLPAGHRAALGHYARVLADLLGLRDWTLYVMHAPPDDAAHLAEVDSDPGIAIARLYFRPDFADLGPDDVRHTVTHELMHCHRRPVMHLNAETLRPRLSADVWATWQAAFILLDETAVEAQSAAVAALLPAFDGWPSRQLEGRPPPVPPVGY